MTEPITPGRPIANLKRWLNDPARYWEERCATAEDALEAAEAKVADAWDEGWRACCLWSGREDAVNPYRAALGDHPELPAGHRYLSTACHHARTDGLASHSDCRKVCKYGGEPCGCDCGHPEPPDEEGETETGDDTALAMVRQFHTVFGLSQGLSPALPDRQLVELRCALVDEEAQELRDAAEARDLVAVADALGDLAYVVYGAAVSFGIDLDAVLREIHRSNMSKLGRDGKPVVNAAGKVLKGPDYSPPHLQPLLATSGAEGETETPARLCPRRHVLGSLCELPEGHEGTHRGYFGAGWVGWTDEQCATSRVIVCEDVPASGGHDGD